MAAKQDIEFLVGGQHHRLSRAAVVQKLKGVRPGPLRTHAVDVDGKKYPVKEAFSCTTGLDVLDFNTNQARGWFKRLGFDVVRVGKVKGGEKE